MRLFVLVTLLAFVAFTRADAQNTGTAEIINEGTSDKTTDKTGGKKEDGLGKKLGGEILKGVGEGVNDLLKTITDLNKDDQSKWIKAALAGATNADIINDIISRIQSGDLVLPSRKRALRLPSKEELLAKLGEMYEKVKETITDHAQQAKELYDQALENIKAAYGEIKENETVKKIEERIKELIDQVTSGISNVVANHERQTRELENSLNTKLVAHLNRHFNLPTSKRLAREVSKDLRTNLRKREMKIRALGSDLTEHIE